MTILRDKDSKPEPIPPELVREVIRNAANAEPPSALDREIVALAYANISETNARLSEVASEVEPDSELACVIARLGSALRHLAILSERWPQAHEGAPNAQE